MKRCWILALCLFLLSGCRAEEAADSPVSLAPTPSPTAAVLPAEEGPVTIYYPEGAGPDTAAYCLIYSRPVFSGEDAASQQMAASLSLWLEELLDRVESERLPLADRVEGDDLPTTEVTSQLIQAETPMGTFTNVLLYERNWFESSAGAEQRLTTLVFDGDGLECSLAAASGVYDPLPLAAQQVWNIISQDPASYYGDLTLEDVSAALDLYNGFTVAEEGYTLYVQPGILAADESNGSPLEFSFGRNALYPDFVGTLLEPEEYEALLPQVFALATYCGPGFLSWEAPAELPAVDSYTYGVQIQDAVEEEGGLTLRGVLMQGLPGDGAVTPVANVSLGLTQDAQGQWALSSFFIA